MIQINVEKNIPIPTNKHYKFGYIKDALCKMDIGDSFLVSKETDRSAIAIIAKRAGLKVKSKRDGDNIRIWKIAQQENKEEKQASAQQAQP